MNRFNHSGNRSSLVKTFEQTPHLYHVKSGRRINLGSFHLPKIYTGEWRVDTHPRFSPDGRYVCIDAPYQNEGRQLHLIDIRGIIKQVVH